MPIFVGSDVKGDRTVECDVCVVGSGAGGAHVASRLTDAGRKVIVLEDGGFHTSDTFDMTEANMVPRLYMDRGGRATSDQGMAILQGRAVGGTTVINWTTCFRTPKRIYEYWAEHHGVEGISHAALEPHWERIEKRLHIHQMREDQMNENSRTVWRGARKLGWKAEMLYRNVNRCAHSGYCGVGCPIDAKQSMLTTMIPEAVAGGADVYANVFVERVDTDGRKVTSVVGRVRDPKTDRRTGVTLTVKPKVTVLSGGAINTPAILLRSKITSGGRVGRRTFLHPAVGSLGVFQHRVDASIGSPQYIACHEFVDRGDRMSFLIEPGPLFPSALGGFATPTRENLRSLMKQAPHMASIGALAHDGFDRANPDEGAVVTLNAAGLPQIDYPWTPRLVEGLREIMRRTAELHFAAGAVRVYTYAGLRMDSADDLRLLDDERVEPCLTPVFVAHVMGGCAMGKDPKTSVVDSHSLRHHDLDNLFVVDGSVAPTSFTVNPQVSIYGLASWASEHVKGAA